MKFAVTRHGFELAAEVAAALALGSAVAAAIVQLADLSGPMLLLAAGVGGISAALGGAVLLSLVDPHHFATPKFEPAAFPAVESSMLDDGLLVQDVLLLDEPVAARDDPRVVQLFVPGPAELVSRIDDFLDAGHGTSRRGDAPRADASAALHAALADIRQSLR